MKQFWEKTMLILFCSMMVGVGLTFGVAGAYGWLRFLADITK